MNRNLFDDYRKHMNEVELPDSARENLNWAILEERSACSQSSAAHSTRKRLPARPAWRIAAAAACIGVIVFGCLFFTPAVDRMLGGNEKSFALTAYASGIATESAGNVKLALGNFASWGGWYSFDELAWEDASPYENDFIHDTGMEKGYICSIYFDLACEGSGIASLTYELEGEGVYFNFDPARDWSTPPEDFTRYRFTVGPDDLKNADKGFVYIVANVPVEGDLVEPAAVLDEHLERMDEALAENPDENPNERFTQDEMDAYSEAMNQLGVLVQTKAAEMVGESVLTITATFYDGTAESHRYRIAPVEDIEERYQKLMDDSRLEDRTSLFTIEQLS